MAVVRPLCARQAARWPFWKNPEAYAAQLQARGVALVRRAWTDRARMLDELERKGMALVSRGDEYYPPLLRHIVHPPHLLYVYGQTDLTDQFPVAVVGTRRASAYGLNHTRQMAAELANVGVCIVSGLALGIDAAAHTGALDAKGRTVAILGSALDQPYPAENRPLMRRILESGGSVVSEYPPGTVPTKYSFLQRNRIIAGMSLGTLVTEGPKRSGALNTAMRTIENGREVFALPGSVDSLGSQLPNMLIGDGARLVTCADDILAALVIEPKGAPRIPQASAVQPEMTQPVRNVAGRRSRKPDGRISPADWMKPGGRSARRCWRARRILTRSVRRAVWKATSWARCSSRWKWMGWSRLWPGRAMRRGRR